VHKFNFKDVTLLVTHYNRSRSLENLLQAFQQLDCSFESIVVSDDGSRSEHISHLENLQKNFNFILVGTPTNKGLGNNINKGQDKVTTPFTLYVQEDFEPTKLFGESFSEAVQIIKENEDIDIVRFYAYFKFPYLEAYRKGFSRMKFSVWYPGYRKFYYYSDHPHLRRSTFFQKFGRYAEGEKVEKTEYKMMMSFLKKGGKGMYYDNFKDLFVQKNTAVEPSTVKRNYLREANNPVITALRHLYRHAKFNIDFLFGK
jgi:glycosyltransferase involved in cell wall biosynthesis